MSESSCAITLEKLKAAYDIVKSSSLCVRTPLLCHMQDTLGIDSATDLYLKLENTQKTGSFKVRGICNQLHNTPPHIKSGQKKLITMSAGNYGKSFAYATRQLNLPAMVLMPETAPENRRRTIESLGAEVQTMPSSELMPTVEKYVSEQDMQFLHSFDDIHLIHGHASAGLEILEDLPDPDILVVCCGGGGLVSGMAAAIKLSGVTKCRVYAVEPIGANTMFESFKAGQAVSIPTVKSIAAGLAPPFAGKNAYSLCREFVDDVILVSDDEILNAVELLYNSGLVVEPSGAAALAALCTGKIPDTKNKKVVVTITGGNVRPDELCGLMK